MKHANTALRYPTGRPRWTQNRRPQVPDTMRIFAGTVAMAKIAQPFRGTICLERSGTISRKPLRHSHFDTVPCGCSKQAEDEKGRLRVIEERVADYNREIESYRSAIRVLGGDPDEQPAKK
jgi:hypothetical protein